MRDPTLILASAHESQNKEPSFHSDLVAQERQAAVTATSMAASVEVQNWLEEIKFRQVKNNRRILNAKQFDTVKRIANRVMQELYMLTSPIASALEPLRWSLHGGPGIGKSHVLKKI